MLLSVASLDAPFTIAFDARMVVLALLLCLGSAFYLMHLTGMRRPHPTRLVIGGWPSAHSSMPPSISRSNP
jgi:hypothetical protein